MEDGMAAPDPYITWGRDPLFNESGETLFEQYGSDPYTFTTALDPSDPDRYASAPLITRYVGPTPSGPFVEAEVLGRDCDLM